jgi:hypothetical protein
MISDEKLGCFPSLISIRNAILNPKCKSEAVK